MPNEKKTTRKLRAILSADVKGYSLLMADDEAYTIKKLEAYRGSMSDLIRSHSGRVVDAVGDNLFRVYRILMDPKDAGKLIGEEPKPIFQPGTWATVIFASAILYYPRPSTFSEMF